jgi:hypothetical protein
LYPCHYCYGHHHCAWTLSLMSYKQFWKSQCHHIPAFSKIFPICTRKMKNSEGKIQVVWTCSTPSEPIQKVGTYLNCRLNIAFYSVYFGPDLGYVRRSSGSNLGSELDHGSTILWTRRIFPTDHLPAANLPRHRLTTVGE